LASCIKGKACSVRRRLAATSNTSQLTGSAQQGARQASSRHMRVHLLEGQPRRRRSTALRRRRLLLLRLLLLLQQQLLLVMPCRGRRAGPPIVEGGGGGAGCRRSALQRVGGARRRRGRGVKAPMRPHGRYKAHLGRRCDRFMLGRTPADCRSDKFMGSGTGASKRRAKGGCTMSYGQPIRRKAGF
jgi:hypothetical protein